VIGLKDRGRERKERRKKEMTTTDKPKFLSVHVLHIYRRDAKTKLKQPWNGLFGRWNQSHMSSINSRVDDAFSALVYFFNLFLFLERLECSCTTQKQQKNQLQNN